jgi:hypothetical protein
MNFVIFFDGQEGSTAIIQNLMNMNNFGILSDSGVYEPFEEYMFKNKSYGGLGKDMPVDDAIQVIKLFFNREYKPFRKIYNKYSDFDFSRLIFSKQFLGFKMTTNRYPQEDMVRLIRSLSELEVVFFFLARKDNLKCAISKSLGHLKQFEVASGLPRGDFFVDIEKVKYFLKKRKAVNEGKKNLFNSAVKLGLECHKIYYEDFMYGKKLFFNSIAKKIGCFAEIKTKKIYLKKVHPDDLNLVLNYSELKEELAHEVKKSEEIKKRYGSVRKRIKVLEQAHWPHLRSGWPVVSKLILDLHNPNGVLFCDYLDGFFGSGFSMDRPWVGFFHNTPENHSSTGSIYNFHDDRGLKALINKDCFKKSLPKCMGLFTLSKYISDFLKNNTPDYIMVESLLLPTEEVENKFDFEEFASDPSVVTVGHWQRLYGNINALSGIKKKFLKWSDSVNPDWIYEKHGIKRSENIQIVEKLDNKEYDIFLSKNVVFLQLFDAGANNIIVECILRNNPVIVNRLPALYDYLGEDYPLYYENADHAQSLATDLDKIQEGHLYLKNKDKYMFSPSHFMSSFEQSDLYQSLPFFRL